MVIKLYRAALASLCALANSVSKPHLPHVQPVQRMFYLEIDSECMHGESFSNVCLLFENTLVLDGDPEINGVKSFCRFESYYCCYKCKSGSAIVEEGKSGSYRSGEDFTKTLFSLHADNFFPPII